MRYVTVLLLFIIYFLWGRHSWNSILSGRNIFGKECLYYNIDPDWLTILYIVIHIIALIWGYIWIAIEYW